MIFLEVAMLVIGLAAIFYSIRISDSSEKISTEETKEVPVADQDREQEKLQEMLDSFTQKAENVYYDLDKRMSQVSNDKIMGISEYSDQVIEKIEKNHDEVVFLYDMMNEKQEEVKKLVHEIDSLRADLHDESAREYQKMYEQEKPLHEIKKSIALDILELQSGQDKVHQSNQQPDSSAGHIKEEQSPLSNSAKDELGGKYDQAFNYEEFASISDADFDNLPAGTSFMEGLEVSDEAKEDTASVYDKEIARIEEDEAKAKLSADVSEQYQSFNEQNEFVNHNDEIISLYKKGRSILDISKMLSLGQGEVKFVIDLYNAR